MQLSLMPELAVAVINARAFAEFYATQLEWSLGNRISATELRNAYIEWAVRRCRPSLSFVNIRHEMSAFGHRHLMSNGSLYLDARLRPVDGSSWSSQVVDDSVIARLDAAIACLTSTRAQLA